jgi:hypothetical protein
MYQSIITIWIRLRSAGRPLITSALRSGGVPLPYSSTAAGSVPWELSDWFGFIPDSSSPVPSIPLQHQTRGTRLDLSGGGIRTRYEKALKRCADQIDWYREARRTGPVPLQAVPDRGGGPGGPHPRLEPLAPWTLLIRLVGDGEHPPHHWTGRRVGPTIWPA